MKAEVGAKITLKDCPSDAEQHFKKLLTFANPEYYKRANRGLWLGNTPEKIRLYERRGTDLVIPFGMLPEVFKLPNVEYKQWFRPLEGIDYKSCIKPYDYQEQAIDAALKKKQGVIIAPCGAGKTQIGLEIAARIGGRMLWLTHTQELLKQSMERAKSVYGLSGADYGTITSGKINMGNVVTFATVQTMAKIDFFDLTDYWDIVIVDEAHHCVGSPTKLMMFYKVVSGLRARYKFGLTATPERSDGLTPCMYALLGEKCYEIQRGDVADTTCPVVVEVHDTDYEPEYEKIINPDGTLNYVNFITQITQDEARNQQIADEVSALNGKTLVLTDRVDHVQRLRQLITRPCVALDAKRKKERAAAVESLSAGDADVLIATFQLAREGLDIPCLNNVVFATPQKNESIIVQAAGRVARKSQGKDCGHLIDYRDADNILRGWQRKRLNIYRKMGYTLR